MQAIGAFIIKTVLDWGSAIVLALLKAWWTISQDSKATKENAGRLKDEMEKEVPDDKAIEDRSERLLNGDS